MAKTQRNVCVLKRKRISVDMTSIYVYFSPFPHGESFARRGMRTGMKQHDCLEKKQNFCQPIALLNCCFGVAQTNSPGSFRLTLCSHCSVGGAFKIIRKVSVLPLRETIKEESTFRAKALRGEVSE